MGSRGPIAADNLELKFHTAQWVYILLGLRDGHSAPSRVTLNPVKSSAGERTYISEKIYAARILLDRSGREIVIRETNSFLFWITEEGGEHNIDLANSHSRIERKMFLPPKYAFGLRRKETRTLYFNRAIARPDLWVGLRTIRSVGEMERVTTAIAQWLRKAYSDFNMIDYKRALLDRPQMILKMRDLWNYPNKNSLSSDNKRIDFFAKGLAGMMEGISPATATKKLTGWKAPRLWAEDRENIPPK